MSQFAIRLSILATCAAALVAIPTVTPAQASGKHMHTRKHHQHWQHHYGAQAWPMGPAQHVARSYSGEVCPGIGRSFDCKIWPPPFADDPDRKTSRF
jgi:hypothetical protein